MAKTLYFNYQVAKTFEFVAMTQFLSSVILKVARSGLLDLEIA